jgi:hypothetical protein
MTRKEELRSCKTCTIAGEVFEQPISPIKAIRAFCMDCMGGSKTAEQGSIAACRSKGRCPLWPFRFGKNPFSTKGDNMSEEQKQAMADRMRNRVTKSDDEDDE